MEPEGPGPSGPGPTGGEEPGSRPAPAPARSPPAPGRSPLKLLALVAIGSLFGSVPAERRRVPRPIAPGIEGAPLLETIRSRYRPRRPHSPLAARLAFFTRIGTVRGRVELVLTDRTYETRTVPDPEVVDLVRMWPRARVSGGLEQEALNADLHHLFPAWHAVDEDRGNKPFADIPDDEVRRWWASAEARTSPPDPAVRDLHGKSAGDRFEPPESRKGEIARAMTYVAVIHGPDAVDIDWFLTQAATFRRWHALDPVDWRERNRNLRIRRFQGNSNPFILDPSLLDRAIDALEESRRAQGHRAR